MRKEDKLRGLLFLFSFMFILISFFYSCFSLVIAAEGTTDTRWDSLFTEESPDPYCWNDDGGTAFWVYSGGAIYASINDCHRTIVASGSKNDCCDSGYVCDTTTNRCISSEISDCGDYKTLEACVADNASVAVSSVNVKTDNLGYCQGMSIGEEWSAGGGVFCGNYTNSCRCAWKSGNGKCTADYNITKMCTSGPSEVLGTCSFSISELTNCSTGFRTMKWIASWTPGVKPAEASCEDGQKNLPCPAQLSFISTASIILAIVLIVVLYLLMSRKKKVIKKENKRKKNGK